MMERERTDAERERYWRFLDGLKDDFPHRVEGPETVNGFDGDKYGECVSRPVPKGRRTWAFTKADNRDRFAAYLRRL
jgi:hypothetical protein